MSIPTKNGRRPALPDHYSALGVAPTAAYREIETAYWRLAFAAPGERVAELNEAYEVLGDEARRRAYDAQRALIGPSIESQAETLTVQSGGVGGLMARLGWPSV
ncbi:MAG: J domain-containing protein [Dehalococcoidia bacterium]